MKTIRYFLLTVIFVLFLSSAVFSLPAEDVEIINDRQYYPRVHKLFEQAKESIYLVMFSARYYDKYPDSPTNILLRDLAAAKKRGVKVQVILDQGAPSTGKNRPQRLENTRVIQFFDDNNIPYKLDSSFVTTHAKLIIVDGLYTVIGSSNWSYSAMDKNHETNVLVKSPAVAERYERYVKSIR